MRFGGFQKNSFIDYPGKISCLLFLTGCNFTCPFCHNPDLARGIEADPSRLNLQDVLAFLKQRRGLLEAVVITGGEPTLQDDLFQLCERFKQLDYAVKIDTNGSRPHVLEALMQRRLVDYVAMDIKTAPARYDLLAPLTVRPELIEHSIQMIMAQAPDYEFRTTCLKPFVDATTIADIAKLLRGAKRYVLQPFNPHTVLQPEFFINQQGVYTHKELEGFRAIAAGNVDECQIR